MDDWRSILDDRLISAEQAAAMVKSGQTVAFSAGRETYSIGLALMARMGELEDVHIVIPSATYDLGFFDEGQEDRFRVTIVFITGIAQEAIEAHRCDLNPATPFNFSRPIGWWGESDLLLVELSPPDERGFCSFGQSLWNKKRVLLEHRAAGRPVIAEVNEKAIRTYGDNFIHCSEIDYFVEHQTSGAQPGSGTLTGRTIKEPEPYLKAIAGYVSELVKDGDTIQIGVGRTTEPLVRLGMLDGRSDLGYHSEATPPGIISLVKEGVINGRRKNCKPGKVLVTSLGGGTAREMQWAADNPIFELMEMDYVGDMRIVAANDNMVAINNALTIDLTGQVSAESLGSRLISTPGGQVPFHIGATYSKGGRGIHVLPATAQGGKVSRIVPELPAGAVVTIPRYCMDYVVTEYGIARLWGRSLRQRAEELIAVAHPDFRDELRREARRRL